MIKFAITMATYKRKDGSSLKKITKAIESIQQQTYSEWKLFLVGDNYTDHEEFLNIVNLLPKEKITYINLPIAAERDNNKFSGYSLWCSAGVNALNYSINQASKEKYQYITHLDDDDEYCPNHLEEIKKAYEVFPEASFVYTRAKYLSLLLPREDKNIKEDYNNLPPRPEGLVHSSVSWKINEIELLYRNTLEQGRVYPADADMWDRVAKLCAAKSLKTIYLPKVTVLKYDERSILK